MNRSVARLLKACGLVTLVATCAHGLEVRQGQPVLSISPRAQSAAIAPGLAKRFDLNIANTGDGSLDWVLTSAPSWARLSEAGGSLRSGESRKLEVVVSAKGLSSGLVTGRLTFEAPGAAGSPMSVVLALTVDRPERTVSPATPIGPVRTAALTTPTKVGGVRIAIGISAPNDLATSSSKAEAGLSLGFELRRGMHSFVASFGGGATSYDGQTTDWQANTVGYDITTSNLGYAGYRFYVPVSDRPEWFLQSGFRVFSIDTEYDDRIYALPYSADRNTSASWPGISMATGLEVRLGDMAFLQCELDTVFLGNGWPQSIDTLAGDVEPMPGGVIAVLSVLGGVSF